MRLAGLCGGIDRVNENRFDVPHYSFHDSACVLLDNGEVTSAMEEERLNRIKHTNKYPRLALRFCLESGGLTIADLDGLAFGVRESYLDEVLAHRYALAPSVGLQSGRQFLQSLIEEDFGVRLDTRRFHFVDHHLAHACSAYYPSGFGRALVFTADGVGDSLSGSVYVAMDNRLELLHTFPEEDSLGFFYLNVTRYLGYDLFDEYKVMGLAPYGDGERFASVFSRLYELLPEGKYRFNQQRMSRLWQSLPARTGATEFAQSDKDVARAAQITLQRIVGHILEHYRRTTGMADLCLAGGVALNCSMNGELLQRGLFRSIFVQPAAHDAGVSLGAALHAHHRSQEPAAPRTRMRHVYWGGNCGSDRQIETLLRKWEKFVVYERVDTPHRLAAELMSEGTIIGWARGRSEFGPRALGNRSILADPRPAAHKDIINALVKKREAFRPFAPSVLEEYAAEFFEMPDGCESFPFMLFTIPVRRKYRATLQAITHVDGSARVQTVSRQDNECYWRLIDCFREITGVPVLLNTSFNNYAEPIVETAADTLVCFLTTGLPVLFIENWMVRKKARTSEALLSLKLGLPAYAKLREAAAPVNGAGSRPLPAREAWWWKALARISKPRPGPEQKGPVIRAVGNTFNRREIPVQEDVFRMLLLCDGYRSIEELTRSAGFKDEGTRLLCMGQIEELWERRLVSLQP